MHVFDGDPSRLEWRSGPGESTVIAIYGLGGISRENAISGRRPPTDEELSELMEKAKELSKTERRSVYLVLFRVRNGLNDRFVPFAEFFRGGLTAFCRPPWRKGQGLL